MCRGSRSLFLALLMFSFLANIDSLYQAEKHVLANQVLVPIEIDHIVHTRAVTASTRLAGATPVDKGWARRGWAVSKLGPGTYVVRNTVTRLGFSYPSALISGTGRRGVASTLGFTGTFNQSWAGMAPNAMLRQTYLAEASREDVVGQLFR